MQERGRGRLGKKRGDRQRKGGEGERGDWQMGGGEKRENESQGMGGEGRQRLRGCAHRGREEGRREGERENDSERERGWSVWLRKREK